MIVFNSLIEVFSRMSARMEKARDASASASASGPSWVLDEDTCQWVAPIAYPAEGVHVWDEQAGDWVEVTDENS